MSRSMPSLLALLGLAAYAGYQNRDKISEMLADARDTHSAPTGSAGGGLLSEIGKLFQSGDAGSTLSGGLGEMVNRFRMAGHGHAADSWVNSGTNLPMQTNDLEAALGDDTLLELEQKTGLSRDELLRRLATTLPDMVNKMTPDGRLPSPAEASRLGEY